MEFKDLIGKYENDIKVNTISEPVADEPSGTNGDFIDMVYTHFDVENNAIAHEEHHKKVEAIYNYLSKRFKAEDIASRLKELEGSIGEPEVGQTRLDHVYGYVLLNDQRGEIEDKLKGYNSGDKISTDGQSKPNTIRDTAGDAGGGVTDGDAERSATGA